MLFAAAAINGAIAHIVPILTDRGIAASTATTAVAAAGLSLIIGRILSGLALDRFFGRRYLLPGPAYRHDYTRRRRHRHSRSFFTAAVVLVVSLGNYRYPPTKDFRAPAPQDQSRTAASRSSTSNRRDPIP
jgi:hypothetical protein